MDSDLLLAVVIATALGFGFSNGALDTPTFLSSLFSTRAVKPRVAVAGAAVLNFAGAFLTLQVAVTLSERIVSPAAVVGSDGLGVVLAALAGALVWTVLTARLGLSPSSSHSLIGGLVGAALAAAGLEGVDFAGLVGLALLPAVVAPLVALVLGSLLVAFTYWLLARRRPGPVGRAFRSAQHLSGGFLAFAHGSNDAQKTMGVIVLALIANGTIGEGEGTPTWVVLGAALAISVGTIAGAWRGLGRPVPRIIKMDPAQAFVAQSSSAATILVASLLGFPLSTTQVMNGGVIGSGGRQGLSARRWGLARSVTRAWLLTFPVTALIGAAAFGVSSVVGGGLAGGLLSLVVTAGVAWLLIARSASRASPTAVPDRS